MSRPLEVSKKPPAEDGASRQSDSWSFVRARLTQYLDVLKKYSVVDGRSGRSEFWNFAFISAIIYIVLTLPAQASSAFLFLPIIFSVAILLPAIGVATRRLHDTNRSGWWLLVPYLPIVFLALGGDAGDNRYDSSIDRGKARLHAIQLSLFAWVLVMISGWIFIDVSRPHCTGVWVEMGGTRMCEATSGVYLTGSFADLKPNMTEKRIGEYLLYSGLIVPFIGLGISVISSDRKKRTSLPDQSQ